MITYAKRLLGINLIIRTNGSAMYRGGIVPAAISVLIYYLFDKVWDHGANPDDHLGHPYGAGVLITSVSFLIIFRANSGYQRYWEGCGAVHHMMSKWLDAVVHTGAYHLQQSHYDKIKPPSYYDHHELNARKLWRDRQIDGQDVASVKYASDPSRRVGKPAPRSIERIQSLTSSNFGAQFHAKPTSMSPNLGFGELLSTDAIARPDFLMDRGRKDGGWGMLFDDGRSTYHKLDDPRESNDFWESTQSNPVLTFASDKGGRSPSLFLQELAHLASLCCAVAFSTLRNDIEGAQSPLEKYHPGSPWPEVDPAYLSNHERKLLRPHSYFINLLKYLLGFDRTPEARIKYNSARPMRVIGGVSDNEIAYLQRARGPSAKVTLAWHWLSEFIVREHLAGSLGKVGPPIISRIIQFLSDGMIHYNHARKIAFIPFPFPHAQLSAFFICIMVVTVPLLMDQYANEFWLGACLTFFTVLCLTALHEVATELENPYRNFPNDIPLNTLLALFNESLITMYAGYHPDHYWNGDEYLYNGNESMNGEMNSDDKADKKPQSVAPSRELMELRDLISKQKRDIDRLEKLLKNQPGGSFLTDTCKNS
mmetsp:Transcript_18555/g.26108  ORF Transcript_18555/g.26108 Transcript_18555/m.26108 type:complete len:593 (+) Transcript_18555:266-2044(+)|eukprot:CAMPEP_0184871344 /NCGR_PEP_ID=MMETSP0580-20130426/40663_1 /TAXON_ID=1118495 /ORGANISM="Dactyliosolen fragilissimus" /LENGTH=592 /DNA_ID=CAMNT_0027373987 /DNA_START=220 /DNA_END=1998 /DNA_ORIENTATION=+